MNKNNQNSALAPHRDTEVIYQVYPSSFNDSNADGMGDLNGIKEKLPYIYSLGVDAVWISPFYECPPGRDGDGGYAINDYRKIDQKYGTLDDFKSLLTEAHALGLRVYTDFVMCHTSNQHEWFKKSKKREAPYEDYYVWHDGIVDDQGNKLPPNNWKSVFGGNAWSFDDDRQQWYLHHFLKSQPALNNNIEKVQDAVMGEMKFWLDMGVDGFRFDAMPFVNYDSELRDNPWLEGRPQEKWEDQRFEHSICQPQTLEMIKRVREMMDSYPIKKTSLGEAISGPEGGGDSVPLAASYVDRNNGFDMCYTNALMSIYNEYPSQGRLKDMIEHIEKHFPDGGNCNAASNHDIPRSGTRMTATQAEQFKGIIKRQLMKLFITLPGSFCLYQGEELGLDQASIPDDIPHDMLKDEVAFTKGLDHSRDGARTPMPWNCLEKNSGFSESDSPYLPVPAHHASEAVNLQDADPASMLSFTRHLLQWRKAQPALIRGKTTVINTDDPVLTYIRESDEQIVLCMFNLSETSASVTLSDHIDDLTAKKLGVTKGQKIILGAFSSKVLGANPVITHSSAENSPLQKATAP